MNTYLVTAVAKLYAINRLVEASTPAEAVAKALPDQYGLRTVWVEEVTGQEEGL